MVARSWMIDIGGTAGSVTWGTSPAHPPLAPIATSLQYDPRALHSPALLVIKSRKLGASNTTAVLSTSTSSVRNTLVNVLDLKYSNRMWNPREICYPYGPS